MRMSVKNVVIAATTVALIQVHVGAQNPDGSKARVITVEEMSQLDKFEGQFIELTVAAKHLGSERVFAVGKENGQEVRVLIPNPSIDTAAAGNMVTILGTVRRFDAKRFGQQYTWFHEADYKTLMPGALVIVASSVRSPGGGELVPGDPATKKAPTINQ
jgi:hypothetical protein